MPSAAFHQLDLMREPTAMSQDLDPAPNPYAAPTQGGAIPPSYDPVGYHSNLATKSERFAGAFIDGIILVPIMLGVGFVLGIAMVSAGIDPASPMFQLIASIVGGILGAIVFTALHGYFLATRGQTIGKIAMKTQIVSEETNQILPLTEIILKRYVPIWLASMIPVIGGFAGLVDALPIFRESRKCIHDEIAKTKVIKLPT